MVKQIKSSVGRPYDPRRGHYTAWEEQMLNERLIDLKRVYKFFKQEKIKKKTQIWPFFLNDSKLIKIGMSFINDIKEFKLVHDADGGTDNLKRAAYLSRWIAKLRPIEFGRSSQYQLESTLENRELAFLNEEFAIYIFLLYLSEFDFDTLDLPVVETVSKQLKYVFSHGDPQRELLVALASVTQIAITAQK
jgi:hypothetical protein